jgi:serine/threonine protein kinase
VYGSLEEALAACAVVAKVADFGMSTRLQAEQTHASGVTCGTLFYMAPEVRESHKLHPESDAYSYGVMMWELMMGCLVYYSSCAAPPRCSSAHDT